jgi:hypothetical protein
MESNLMFNVFKCYCHPAPLLYQYWELLMT